MGYHSIGSDEAYKSLMGHYESTGNYAGIVDLLEMRLAHESRLSFEFYQAAEIALRHVKRNEDFRKFLDIMIEEGKSEVLRNMDRKNLSKQKTRLLRDALDTIERDSSSNELS